jgi:hypothetical protein
MGIIQQATLLYRVSIKKGSSGMLSRVALVRTDVSEKISASIIRVSSC